MRLIALLLSSFFVSISSELGQDSIEYWNEIGRLSLEKKVNSEIGKLLVGKQAPPKNVILFIGDGMGIATITAARIARNQKKGNSNVNAPFFFETFPFSGLSKTASFDTHTTDSAAAAMALLTGRKVEQNTVGRVPGFGNKCEQGEKARVRDGIADLAIEKGIDIGLVTTASVTDATPAALYAKDAHRQMEFMGPALEGTKCEDIAAQLLGHPADKFKVMMGGGHSRFLPSSIGGNRTDGRNLEDEWIAMRSHHKGYSRKLLVDAEEFVRHKPRDNEQLLGLFAPIHFPYRLDDTLKNRSSVPRLSEMATKAVQVLSKQHGSQGFFLLVEGANIDKAQHKNRFHLAVEELSEFDRAIEQVSRMVDEETLILVTADHAHALTIPGYLSKNQSIFQRDGNVTSIFFATGPGIGDGNRTNYTAEEAVDPHFAQPSSIYNKDARHGAEDVGIWAKGPYSWLFTGSMENTQVSYNIKYLLCLDKHEKSLCDLRKTMADQRRAEDAERLTRTTTSSPQNETFHVFNMNLPVRATLFALIIIVAILVVLLIGLILLLLRSSFRQSVKPSENRS